MACAALTLNACSTSTQVLDRAVGPAPSRIANAGSDGTLQVFTALQTENDVGFEFPYSQRTAYDIYTAGGKRVRHVNDNNCGHFDDTPRTVALAAGTYEVRAFMAEGYGQWTRLPVVIEPGQKTEVHLDSHWKPPTSIPEEQLVRASNGLAVGWRAASNVAR